MAKSSKKPNTKTSLDKFSRTVCRAALIFGGLFLILGIVAWATMSIVEDHAIRKFTIKGIYSISEIRINVDVANRPTINADRNLLTLGFDPDSPINESSEFLARYVDAGTRQVVEKRGQNNMTDYVSPDVLPELLAKVEKYRQEHVGQSLVFDRSGRITVTDSTGKKVQSGGYLWGGHTLSVVMLDPAAPAPRYNSRNYLFFADNEEIMQGTNCRRIIVREKSSSRQQGSIELLFGFRCPNSAQPR